MNEEEVGLVRMRSDTFDSGRGRPGGLSMIQRFLSGQDFHMGEANEEGILRESQLVTPRVLRSHGTSAGRPDYERLKNNP